MRSPRPSRREFAASLAAVTLAACARTAPRPAPEPAVAPTAPPGPTESPPPAAPSPAPTDAAGHLLGVVTARYGEAFPAGHRDDVRAGIARTQRLADRLRRVPITNAADPFTVCGAGMGGEA